MIPVEPQPVVIDRKVYVILCTNIPEPVVEDQSTGPPVVRQECKGWYGLTQPKSIRPSVFRIPVPLNLSSNMVKKIQLTTCAPTVKLKGFVQHLRS